MSNIFNAVESPAEEPAKNSGISWWLFLLLAVMVLVSSVLIIPYSIRLASAGGSQFPGQTVLLAAVTFIQAVVINLPLLLAGMFIARRMGLGAPYLEALARRRPAPAGFKRVLIIATVVGLVLGGVLLVLAGLFSQILPEELTGMSVESLPTAFEGFLASISAGINEEVILRLFLLSLVAWGIQAVIRRRTTGRPSGAILWAANVASAVIFGLLHLANLTIMNIPITPETVLYVIVMNGLAGLGFGWLYWTFGLESAMLAHFSTDIVLHVIARLFGQ